MKIELIPPVVKTRFKQLIQPLVGSLVRYHLNPNWFTTFSFFIIVAAAVAFGRGALRLGATLMLLGGMLDMLDGAVARASNRVTRFGALYDSTLDRYAEIAVFFGFAYYFVHKTGMGAAHGLLISMVVFIAMAGSLMVSYVRARAEGLHFDCKVGVMQRPERLVLLSLGAYINDTWLVVMLVVVAFFANLTAIQRLVYIWRSETTSKWKKVPSDIAHE
ncbi:MAG TPA: CDP-alcohol phosphatidyltransferase family protein [bacterium]|nr:CDP-alcohol phosphatidyltransferase family protein [bacterium]HQG46187.1 CDP-alcohol phosphatidyltransferase family protein [bacterium]HQI49208.1 CDP-alcohol phosphatidyltransferase family protein [bacterium]HQJ64301.1 CDP-alcohol phosphatidyltransferase family protein [bacterium]